MEISRSILNNLEKKIEKIEQEVRVLVAEKNGKFSAFDYKNLQGFAEFLEEDRNSLRKDNAMMRKFIKVMR